MTFTSQDVASSVLHALPNLMQIIGSKTKMDARPFPQLQFRTLMWLRTHEGCRMSDLAERFHMSRPAMTACVQALVKRGLVSRQQEPDDRRVVEIVLTPAGINEIEKWGRILHEALSQELEGLSPADSETVIAAMRILSSAFGIEEWVQGEPLFVVTPTIRGKFE